MNPISSTNELSFFQRDFDNRLTAPTGTVRVTGGTIHWPDDGWYEVQYAESFNTVSQGGRSVSVEAGVYNVINHTTGERFESIEVVGESSQNVLQRDSGLDRLRLTPTTAETLSRDSQPTQDSNDDVGVYICTRPVNISFIPSFLAQTVVPEHTWVRTTENEAGMGGECATPGQNCSDMPFSQVQVTDHTGQSEMPDASCTLMNNVDEDCVDDRLGLGEPLGRWTPINQCQSFAWSVVTSCRTGPQIEPSTSSTPTLTGGDDEVGASTAQQAADSFSNGQDSDLGEFSGIEQPAAEPVSQPTTTTSARDPNRNSDSDTDSSSGGGGVSSSQSASDGGWGSSSGGEFG